METTYKLEPHRTMHLQGVDRFGAMGALWGTSATGFSVSGVFRDMADFAILTLWDADDYFGHYQSTKYLPDFDFTGMVLTFDIEHTGAQPLDSPAFQWVPWRSLSYQLANGEPGSIDLAPYITFAGGTYTAAVSEIKLVAGGPLAAGDRVMLWYQNIAYDFTVPTGPSVSMSYFGGTSLKVHDLVVGAVTYTFTEASGGSSSNAVALGLQTAASADPNCLCTVASGSNVIVVTPLATVNTGAVLAIGDGGTDGNGTGQLWIAGAPLDYIAGALGDQINAAFSGAVAVDATGLILTWLSGDLFDSSMVGQTIVLGSTPYTVQTFTDSKHLVLSTAATTIASIAYTLTFNPWGANPLPLTATTRPGGYLKISCGRAGADGNSITLYSISANTNLQFNSTVIPLSGGVSGAVWSVSIDFSALGIASLMKAWLTIAPQIQNSSIAGTVSTAGTTATWLTGPQFNAAMTGAVITIASAQYTVSYIDSTHLGLSGSPGTNASIAYALQGVWPMGDFAPTEWLVSVTNWAVSDPGSKRALSIAGAGSNRIGSRDAGVSYAGSSWIEEASNQPGGTGWFSGGYAHRMSAPGDSVTIRYSCGSTHNLYVGTSLYIDRGIASVVLDGGSPFSLDCYYNQATEPIVTRRLVVPSVAAGTHTVILTLQSGNHTALGAWDANSTGHYFYFDYLEATVQTAVPDPAVTYSNLQGATDYDTDHSYRLSPQRLVWMLQKCGFAAAINHYMGVFWWNQRTRIGGSFPSATIEFTGTWISGDSAFLDISGTSIGKSVFPADTTSTIAAHFAYFINETFIGIRASAAGAVLTIINRTPEFSFTYTASKTSTAGTILTSGILSGGVEGVWQIDDTVTPVINRAATDWHTDFWATVNAAGLTGVASFSMELVNPPDAGGHVYAQRFPDGTAVETDTGFGGLFSTQCTFNATFRAYQQQAFAEMAGMMAAAGLTPWLQFGEFLWWYFARAQGVPIGYASFTAPISMGTAVPHNLTTGARVVQAGVLGNTAANGPFTITVVDATHYTLNGSSGNGAYISGGAVTGGGMAFYDADTAAAASTALGRAMVAFEFPTDDPSVNTYADANFLAGLVKAHTDAIRAYVIALYSGAKFELLWPYDVNYPTPTAVAQLGGRLNRYVNLPVGYQAKSGSGLDRFKMEALAFGSVERDNNLAVQAMRFPYTSPMTWAEADTAYLFPWFNGGCPWNREWLACLNSGVPLINAWAVDHLFLLSWPLPMPGNRHLARVF